MGGNPGGKAAATPGKKNNRKRGGFAMVEVLDGGRMLGVLDAELAGQKECRAALLGRIDKGEVKADGERQFGIIQIKDLKLVPKMKPAKVTL